jgi:hypothetical protein
MTNIVECRSNLDGLRSLHLFRRARAEQTSVFQLKRLQLHRRITPAITCSAARPPLGWV